MKFIKGRAFKTETSGSVHLINLDCVTDIFMEATGIGDERRVSQIVVNLSNGENIIFTDEFASEFYKELRVNGVIN